MQRALRSRRPRLHTAAAAATPSVETTSICSAVCCVAIRHVSAKTMSKLICKCEDGCKIPQWLFGRNFCGGLNCPCSGRDLQTGSWMIKRCSLLFSSVDDLDNVPMLDLRVSEVTNRFPSWKGIYSVLSYNSFTYFCFCNSTYLLNVNWHLMWPDMCFYARPAACNSQRASEQKW